MSGILGLAPDDTASGPLLIKSIQESNELDNYQFSVLLAPV